MSALDRLRWQVRTFRDRQILLRKPFAFIHINKCGGTSVERSLGLPFAHMTAAEMRDRFGPARWEQLFRFTLVRNPFDRVASLYSFRVKTGQTGMGDGHIGFEDWLFECFDRGNPHYRDKPRFFLPCHDWLVDAEGRMLVDNVFRLEEMPQAWPVIQRRTGIDAPLAHVNASRSAGRGPDWSAPARALVARVFARDFETFGYTAETAAML